MTEEDGLCECKRNHTGSGHYLLEGKMVRCECMEAEIRRRVLGPMFTDRVQEKTQLKSLRGRDIVVEGPLAGIRTHVARVLLNMRAESKTWLTIDAYRLIEIFLGEDREHISQYEAIDPDLLILIVGFADPRNKYLPELMLQVLARREMLLRPTWVVLNLPVEAVAAKYNSALGDYLVRMKKVIIK